MGNQEAPLSVPLYYQIRTRLLDGIESGQYQPGDRVPSERELTEQYSVSRMTARQALKELEQQGYLFRMQGKGTFVATTKLDQPVIGLTSFTEDMHRRGLEAGARVLSAGEAAAGFLAGRYLGIDHLWPVFRLERLHLANGEPLGLEVAHLPVTICAGLTSVDFVRVSLYTVLAERFGIHFQRAVQSCEAAPASGYEAEALHVKEGVPLLLINRLAFDQQDRPVEFTRSWYRGDRYRFTTELVRREES